MREIHIGPQWATGQIPRLLQAERAEVEELLDRADANSVEAEADLVEVLAADLVAAQDRVLRAKNEAEQWLNEAKRRVATRGGYANHADYSAYEQHFAWAKQTHQALLMAAKTWRTEAQQRRRVVLGKPATPSSPDLGAEVIYAAYRYRADRTARNGKALDEALAILSESSLRWRDVARAMQNE